MIDAPATDENNTIDAATPLPADAGVPAGEPLSDPTPAAEAEAGTTAGAASDTPAADAPEAPAVPGEVKDIGLSAALAADGLLPTPIGMIVDVPSLAQTFSEIGTVLAVEDSEDSTMVALTALRTIGDTTKQSSIAFTSKPTAEELQDFFKAACVDLGA